MMKYCTSRGGKRSSSTFIARSRRFTAPSWSCESRIWNSRGRPASRWCARSRRLHRPWKVPIHMPRGFTASIAARRVSISRAALLVKVTASTPAGDTAPCLSSQAMRVVSTRVLPLPAPARISAWPSGSVTAASCSGLRCSRCSDKAPPLYGARARRPLLSRLRPAGGPARARGRADRAHQVVDGAQLHALHRRRRALLVRDLGAVAGLVDHHAAELVLDDDGAAGAGLLGLEQRHLGGGVHRAALLFLALAHLAFDLRAADADRGDADAHLHVLALGLR